MLFSVYFSWNASDIILSKAYAISSHSMLDSVSQILRKIFATSHLLVIQFRRKYVTKCLNFSPCAYFPNEMYCKNKLVIENL